MHTAAILTLLSPVTALFVAVWGFRRSRRADQLRAFFEIQDRYLSPEVRDGRRIVHRSLAKVPTDEMETVGKTERDRAAYALAVMNSIAIACQGGYVDRSMVRENMGRSFATTITAAKEFIDHLERTRGFRPYRAAEQLASDLAIALDITKG